LPKSVAKYETPPPEKYDVIYGGSLGVFQSTKNKKCRRSFCPNTTKEVLQVMQQNENLYTFLLVEIRSWMRND